MGEINIRSYEASWERSSTESGDFRRLHIESRAPSSPSAKWGSVNREYEESKRV